MDGRRVWSRRRFLLGAPLLAVGTAGCMRFASDSSAASLELSIDDADVPTEAALNETLSLRVPIVNHSTHTGEGTVVVTLDDRTVTRESIHVEAESETTLEADVTPTEPGEHELGVAIEREDGESVAGWSETLVVTGRRLTFEWAETFVPAEHSATADSTRHLAYACFLVQFRAGDTVVEEYAVGSDANIEFVDGAYPVGPITDARLERFDGEPGRWLGTEDRRTALVVPEPELLERAETLELYGFSLFEQETTVRIRDGDTTIDTTTVPPRDAGESVLEVDLRDYETGS